ncbi:MAG: hypothetical protein NXI16_03480 [Alphaproteobacteria bacterium]|nr:hypothetical protein [Alphaproteobacteria bacterium]
MKRHQLDAEERQRQATCLGDIADSGVDVFCWCNRCGHNAVIETARLMAELGPGFPVPEIGAKMRCSSCGSKDVATRPSWPSLGQVTRHD